ncbi:sigma factor-like helix-turn-helix DNA-binding protein [Viridibacillus arvi]|uniref:sigma factor-like helix-turn-helix DNA-binding protein n=1 Tax=Viridibacillus arvi TaxID=263475 RepID=UPI003D0435F0
MQNRLLETFLSDTENQKLYNSYSEFPTAAKREIIEKRFEYHAKKIHVFSYFTKILLYESRRFDIKNRRLANQNLLVLDKDIDDSNESLLDLLESRSIEEDSDYFTYTTLEETIEDKHLHSIVSSLSVKQKEILYLIYIKNLDEETIAVRLDITKQAVNKTKNKALKQIKDKYRGDTHG